MSVRTVNIRAADTDAVVIAAQGGTSPSPAGSPATIGTKRAH